MQIISIGECMIELSNIKNNQYNFGYAGDTANSAIYLSRLGAKTTYVTSVGNDILSIRMVNFLKNENIQTNKIHFNNKKTIGLYIIQNEENGEKKFYQWRSDSAAKTLFENVHGNKLIKSLIKFNCIYFSGITLSIYNNNNQIKFYKVLNKLKKSGLKIYFDFNIRINNWVNKKTALESIEKFSQIADIVFFGKDDLNLLKIDNYKKFIVKNYSNKLVIYRPNNGNIVIYNKNKFLMYKIKLLKKVKDTTGCGDAFNACFIYNYFYNHPIEDCIKIAHKLGKKVAQTKGAIINKKFFKKDSYAL